MPLALLFLLFLTACGPQTSCEQCKRDCNAVGATVSQCDPNATPDNTTSCRCGAA